MMSPHIRENMAKLQALLPRYDRVIVVYGDCGTGGRLDEVLARYPAVRPAGFHCFQWYAGELYRRFEDATEFMDELKDLLEKGREGGA